jgi:hypothetical protein
MAGSMGQPALHCRLTKSSRIGSGHPRPHLHITVQFAARHIEIINYFNFSFIKIRFSRVLSLIPSHIRSIYFCAANAPLLTFLRFYRQIASLKIGENADFPFKFIVKHLIFCL